MGKLDNCQRLHNREIDPVSDYVECQYGKQTCAVSLGKMVHSRACGFSNCPTSEDTSLASSKARLLDPENTRECCTSVESEKLGCKIESVKDIPMENLSQEWKLNCFVDHLYGGGKRKKADSDSDFSPQKLRKAQVKRSNAKRRARTEVQKAKRRLRRLTRTENQKAKRRMRRLTRTEDQKAERRMQRQAKSEKRRNDSKYDEASENPPTEDQVHYCGLYTSNVKAAISASQAPDPRRTMLFFQELFIEIQVQPIVKFVFDNFTSLAPDLDDEQYSVLRHSAEDMLKSIDLFI